MFETEVVRVQRGARLALIGANVVGAIVVFVLGVFVIPAPNVPHQDRLRLLNAAVMVGILAIGFPLAIRHINRCWEQVSGWLREDRKPTPTERDETIGFPLVLVRTEAILWALAAVPFVAVNAPWSWTIAIEAAVEILLGGVTTCALAYLLDERISRPLVAEALSRTPLEQSEPVSWGVRARLTLAWVAGAALATARTLRTRLEADLPSTRAAIGVSAGTVVAGNVGTPERYEYTVIGDPVNEAARLTDLAKTLPSRLLASDAALERAQPRERMRWRTGESVELRGRSQPTVVATIA
jgi:hypothetical protein